MSDFEKGSEWRKWDLHVHSPESHGFIGDWGQFKQQLQNADCDAIGINDYFSVAGYKKLQDEINNKTLDIGNRYILPIVEMRMVESVQNKNTKTNSASHFNFHIIFNPKIRIDDIETFIKSLKSEGTHIGADYNDKKKLQNKKVSFFEVLGSLKGDSKFKDNFLIWLPYDEYGGIDEIDPRSDEWIKGDFIRKSDILGSSNKKQIDFFLWISPLKKDGSPKFTEQKFRKWFERKRPCIKGSDSHNHKHPIGKLKDKNSNPTEKFCWIKADLTFDGLKQIIYEPDERVYIGEEPPILSKIENNKTNYLRSLEINQVNSNQTGDTWFKNISITFNKELVAIIGRKGSGKSGIADMLGLLGDTHTNKEHFSFLHRDKFLKGKLADGFKAKIVWESGGESDDTCLSASPKLKKPESVRFIPQNYFEELTNEIEINKFQRVLENIIFEYIPETEKLEKSSFKELEDYKMRNVNAAIQQKIIEITNINRKIIAMEAKKHPDYLRKVEGEISRRMIDINEQKKMLKDLPAIANPNTDSENSEQGNNTIAQHNKQLDKLKATLKRGEEKRLNLTNKIEAVKQLKERIKQQKQLWDEFMQNYSREARGYGLTITKILKVKTDYSSIDTLISAIQQELNEIEIYFESFESIKNKKAENNNKSLVYKMKVLSDKVQAETEKLSGKERIFQQNEQKKQMINDKIKSLTGDSETPSADTLNFYKKEEKFITKNLMAKLKEKRAKRIKKSLEIFTKKKEVIKLYNSFKASVDDTIRENKALLANYDIKIDSSFDLNTAFYREFLEFVNQNLKGNFRGIDEGETRIKSIVEDSGFSDESKIKALLTNIIADLEFGKNEISNQVNSEKLNAFYDYVFSLGYINPKYELKLGGKALAQLSPGERGALLLIFYLMIDKEEIPLVIDQPEDNLDNESVYNMLSKFIKHSKKKRQIIMVTHNPNLAVGADAEQIICVNIDKQKKNEFSFVSGSIENPIINHKIVQILEGTKPAFDKRKLKYQKE